MCPLKKRVSRGSPVAVPGLIPTLIERSKPSLNLYLPLRLRGRPNGPDMLSNTSHGPAERLPETAKFARESGNWANAMVILLINGARHDPPWTQGLPRLLHRRAERPTLTVQL